MSKEQSFSWVGCHLLLEGQPLLPNEIDFSVLCPKGCFVRADGEESDSCSISTTKSVLGMLRDLSMEASSPIGYI